MPCAGAPTPSFRPRAPSLPAAAFVFWLKESGVEANRHSICHAIAEKACVWLGAPFNAEELRDD